MPGYISQLQETHSFENVSFAMLSIVDSDFISRPQYQLLQVQPEWPGVLRVQSPDTVQRRTLIGWRGEGPIKCLEKPSTGPLSERRRHSDFPVTVSLCIRLPFGLFSQCDVIFWRFWGFHFCITVLFICAKARAFIETLHPAITAPGEGKAPASQAFKGSLWAFTSVWKSRKRRKIKIFSGQEELEVPEKIQSHSFPWQGACERHLLTNVLI